MNSSGAMFRLLALAAAVPLAWLAPVRAEAQARPSGTQVVMLGTGTPLPDPDRAGPATAIVVNGSAYLVDAGTGVVRRAAAARRNGIEALEPTNLKIAFLTHLHSDHTLGLADLILTPWTMGRTAAMTLYGPAGTKAMADRLIEAYAVDIRTRTTGLEASNATGYRVDAHDVSPGRIFKDANVTVTAFNAHHGSIDAYGYRFDTADRSIVIGGDGSGKTEITANCRRCDLLIAETYTEASFALVPPQWKVYRQAYHTSTRELAAIATESRPGLLVLYHRGNAGCDQIGTQECRDAGSEAQMLKEIRATYSGKVVAARDLDVY